METKKLKKLIYLFFVGGVILCTLMHIPGVNYEGADGGGYSWDAFHTYIPQIEGRQEVSNWHSSLLMYEGRACRSISFWLTGSLWSGIEILRGMWFASAIVVAANFLLWLWFGMHRWLGLACMVIPFLYCFFFYIDNAKIGLDFFFMPIILSCFSVAVLLGRVKRKFGRWALFLLLLVLMFHMVEFRRNSAILLPVFLYIAVGKCEKRVKRIAVSLIGSFCFAFVSVQVIPAVLPVKKMLPIVPMLAGDTRISYLLRGELERIEWPKSNSERYQWKYAYALTQCGESVFECGNEKIIRDWLDEWRRHPIDMLVGRSIQLIEFYWGGIMPCKIRPLYEKNYPALLGNADRWVQVGEVSCDNKLYLTCRNLSIIASLVLAIALIAKEIRKPVRESERVLLAISVLAVLYALSYTFIIPTADIRYLIPSYLLSVISLSLLVLLWIRKLSLSAGYSSFLLWTASIISRKRARAGSCSQR